MPWAIHLCPFIKSEKERTSKFLLKSPLYIFNKADDLGAAIPLTKKGPAQIIKNH